MHNLDMSKFEGTVIGRIKRIAHYKAEEIIHGSEISGPSHVKGAILAELARQGRWGSVADLLNGAQNMSGGDSDEFDH